VASARGVGRASSPRASHKIGVGNAIHEPTPEARSGAWLDWAASDAHDDTTNGRAKIIELRWAPGGVESIVVLDGDGYARYVTSCSRSATTHGSLDFP